MPRPHLDMHILHAAPGGAGEGAGRAAFVHVFQFQFDCFVNSFCSRLPPASLIL